MNPFDAFGAIHCIQTDAQPARRQALAGRWAPLGLSGRVRDFEAVATPGNPAVSRVLAHRSLVEAARREGLDSVLVLEQDLLWLDSALPVLQAALPELARLDWQLCALGGLCWDAELAARPAPPLAGAAHWRPAAAFSCTHAVGYHARSFDRLLHDLPADFDGVDQWLARHHGLEHYQRSCGGMLEITCHVASLPYLLPYEQAEHQFHFTA